MLDIKNIEYVKKPMEINEMTQDNKQFLSIFAGGVFFSINKDSTSVTIRLYLKSIY